MEELSRLLTKVLAKNSTLPARKWRLSKMMRKKSTLILWRKKLWSQEEVQQQQIINDKFRKKRKGRLH